MMLKCVICNKEFEPPYGFCLTSMRGTSSACERGCVVICDDCLEKFKSLWR